MNPKHPLVAIRETLSSSATRNHETEYKREIVDLFRDYRHPWDIFTELIQNSVDAINQHATPVKGEIILEITNKCINHIGSTKQELIMLLYCLATQIDGYATPILNRVSQSI